MTQGEKDLLFKDLCARLPYGVKVQYLTEGDKTYICNVDQVSIKSQCVGIAETGHTVFTWRTIDRIKPYLRPLSSMTKDEEDELDKIDKESSRIFFDDLFERKKKEGRENLKGFLPDYPTLDWLNSHHFDYRGLIKKGLALEAPEDMYEL